LNFDKDKIIFLLAVLTIYILIILLSGCSTKEKLIIDKCVCDCENNHFECTRDWQRSSNELSIDNLSIPQK
jgi:uncharacterized protein YceK